MKLSRTETLQRHMDRSLKYSTPTKLTRSGRPAAHPPPNPAPTNN